MAIDYEAEILRHCLFALEAWGGYIVAGERWALNPTFEIAVHGIEYRPAFWMDRALEPFERQGFSRGARELERLGLLDLVGTGRRLRFLRPTPKGLTIAVKLLRGNGEAIDLDIITAALGRAAWATPGHLDAVQAKEPSP